MTNPPSPNEALREALDLVFRIEAAGVIMCEAENFERWKETARRIAPTLREADADAYGRTGEREDCFACNGSGQEYGETCLTCGGFGWTRLDAPSLSPLASEPASVAGKADRALKMAHETMAMGDDGSDVNLQRAHVLASWVIKLAALSPLSGEPAPSGTVACTEVLEAIKAALGDCELNPANYDHEDVSYLNQCNISAWMLANEALAALASAGKCAPSVPVAFLYQTDTEEWLSRRDDDTPKAECDFKVIPLYAAPVEPASVAGKADPDAATGCADDALPGSAQNWRAALSKPTPVEAKPWYKTDAHRDLSRIIPDMEGKIAEAKTRYAHCLPDHLFAPLEASITELRVLRHEVAAQPTPVEADGLKAGTPAFTDEAGNLGDPVMQAGKEPSDASTVSPASSATLKPTPVEAGALRAIAAAVGGIREGTIRLNEGLDEIARVLALSETPPPPSQEGGDGHD